MSPSGQAALRDRLHRAFERHGADVLRHLAAQPDGELDARAIRARPVCAPALHGRSRGLHAAGSQSAVESGAAAVDEAGARIRTGRRARDSESGGSGLQGAVERRHVVPGAAADGARQGAAARWARRRARVALGGSSIGPKPIRAVGAAEARVLHARRARGRAGHHADALGHVVSARSADARAAARVQACAASRQRPPRPRPRPRVLLILLLGIHPRLQPRELRPAGAAAARSTPDDAKSSTQPVLPPGIEQFYVPMRGRGAAGRQCSRPSLYAATVRFADTKRGVDVTHTIRRIVPFGCGASRRRLGRVGGSGRAGGGSRNVAGAPAVFRAAAARGGRRRGYQAWLRDFHAGCIRRRS